MELSKDLLDDFAEITHDKKEKLQDVTCYGTAVVQDGNEYVRLDAADSLTPATFAVRAHHGDRVMVMIKNHRATVIANITTPSMTLGILNVTDGIIVQGYLTTNEDRTAYDDQTNYGLTFSAGGIGGYGGSGKYWYLTNAGDLYASSAEIVGNITAESGYLGSSTNGFKIDQYGIYSGNDKSGTTTGFIVLANGDFARTINNVSHNDLRFAIGANFAVSSSGVLYATNVDATGKITASSGYIGNATNGFTIDSDGFYSGPRNDRGTAATGNIAFSNTSFTRLINGTSRSDLRFAIGSNFGVDNTGKLYAAGIEVSGKIEATSGTIGSGTNKIDIGAGSIHYLMTSRDDTTHNGFYIGTDGIALGQGKFKVTDTGTLTASDGTIGPWSVNSTSIYRNSSTHGAANGLYFGTSGLSITDKFQVNSAGKLTATGADIGGTITATDGSIAGWQIGTNAIYRANSGTTASEAFNTAGVLYFGTSGISLSNKFYVTSTGSLMASDGTIGPWKIGANAIYRGTNATDTSFNTSGALYFGTQGLSLSDKFSVTSAGALTAILGSIAGWSISSDAISKTTSDDSYRVRLQAPSSATTGNYALRIDQLVDSNWTNLLALTYGGSIIATKGTIAGWELNSTAFYRISSTFGNASGLYFGSSGLSITDKFKVTNAGALTATSATITGSVTATSGKIGNFTLTSTTAQTNPGALYSGSHNSMDANNEGVFIGAAGISLGAGGKIQLDKDGTILLRNNLIIRSDITPISGGTQSGYGVTITNGSNVAGYLAFFYDGITSNGYVLTLGAAQSDTNLEISSQNSMILHANKILFDTYTAIEDYPFAFDDKVEFRYPVKIGTTSSDGSIEIYNSTPYIDFHFNRSTSNYTTRLIENASGVLTLQGRLYNARGTTSFVAATKTPTIDIGYTGTSGAIAGMVLKTQNGRVAIGTYPTNDDQLRIWYISDTDYAANTNNAQTVKVNCNITGHADGDLALSGGTLTGNLVFSTKIDNGIIQGFNGTTQYNILRNHGNGNVSISACGAGMYIGYTNSTFVNFLNGKMSLNSDGQLTLTRSVIVSTTGYGYYLKDGSSTSYGGIVDNGDNLWIGAKSSTAPHHRGSSGNTYISTGYSTTNSAGNSTIYLSVPSLSGTTWSHTTYGVLHTGNYSSYVLPKAGGTVASDITITRSGGNGSHAHFILRNDTSGSSQIALRVNSGTSSAAGLYSPVNAGSSSNAKWLIYVNTSGTVVANTSDRREKNVLGMMSATEAETILRGINIVDFTYKMDKKSVVQNGLIAQELRDLLTTSGIGFRPYLVIEDLTEHDYHSDLAYPEDKVRYSVDYSKFTPILWRGWQIHDDEIATLKQQINELKAEIAALKGAA